MTGRRDAPSLVGGIAWPTITRLTRESMLGIDETQSGHGTISTWPNGASAASASSMALALHERKQPRVEDPDAGRRRGGRERDLRRWSTVPSPASISIGAVDEAVVGADVRQILDSAMPSTGESSTAITVPVAPTPRSNAGPPCRLIVAGSTVGVDDPRTAVSG